jgi:hypothetical protein
MRREVRPANTQKSQKQKWMSLGGTLKKAKKQNAVHRRENPRLVIFFLRRLFFVFISSLLVMGSGLFTMAI